jgi:hypothetical protein
MLASAPFFSSSPSSASSSSSSSSPSPFFSVLVVWLMVAWYDCIIHWRSLCAVFHRRTSMGEGGREELCSHSRTVLVSLLCLMSTAHTLISASSTRALTSRGTGNMPTLMRCVFMRSPNWRESSIRPTP